MSRYVTIVGQNEARNSINVDKLNIQYWPIEGRLEVLVSQKVILVLKGDDLTGFVRAFHEYVCDASIPYERGPK